MREELREVVTVAKRAIDTNFEAASEALMRAFEAYQRCESVLIDEDIDHADITREMECIEPQHRVAVSLHYVLRCCAVSPTGVKAAEAVSAALDRAEIERHASDGVLHPPTRDATVAGLTALIDERTHQLEGLTERHVENDPGTCITTTFTGITTAFRQVLRERDVLIDARDIV
ncbi:MAG: hypothetical protein F4238_11815 [Gemmatimonadetes bacterium]|nr:hypothetical protein [Gemmatimonadota bacterium]